MKRNYKVGIVGGGVSGSVIALELAKYGIESILFEKKESLVNGPPFCHLHAGGNLYPDISVAQCKTLLKQSIDMAKIFPQSIDERPTFISIPKSENKYEVAQIEERLETIVAYYKELIAEDATNEILGAPEEYYKTYEKEELERLAKQEAVQHPKTKDEWMTNAMQLIDHDKLKMPVILVQEYGWNLFRLGAQAQLALQQTDECNLQLCNTVTDIKDFRQNDSSHNWEITANEAVYTVDYLINSCGFKTGEIDKALDLNVERLIEFKAAYVSKWQPIKGLIPELIFHGERGTPNGMAQLTPYCDDYYQIHGMTEQITLFKEGLVKATPQETQPEFNSSLREKLDEGWTVAETKARTESAIDFIAKFVPSFKTATLGGPPMFGAQQIPGDDPSLRVGEVSFPESSYARSEIVKASSALTVAKQIINKMQGEGSISSFDTSQNNNPILETIKTTQIDKLAKELAAQRGYPEALSELVIKKA